LSSDIQVSGMGRAATNLAIDVVDDGGCSTADPPSEVEMGLRAEKG
jgi:hypothetical protein